MLVWVEVGVVVVYVWVDLCDIVMEVIDEFVLLIVDWNVELVLMLLL